jgi:hypothetical protein
MEDKAPITPACGEKPEPRKDGRVTAILTWAGVVAAVLVVAFFLIVPLLTRRGGMGSGSHRYARKWRAQLLACGSLDDVKRQFNCFEIVVREDGLHQRVEVTAVQSGRPRALIQSFPDGRWIACAHASSHGERGGGTIVSRDSDGEVHVFFGHVCWSVWAHGDTLEESYTELRGYNEVEEKPLTEFE